MADATLKQRLALILARLEHEVSISQAAARLANDDDYCDFFVEGSGPPWHETVDDFGIREQFGLPAQRAFALRRSNVLQTFTRIAEEVAGAKR